MERPASVHPADETLVSYGLGKLDETLAESVNKHLEQCVPCRQRVAELSSDSFVGRLRDAQPEPDSKPASPKPARPKTIVEPDRPRPSRVAGKQAAAAVPSEPTGTLPPELANHPQYEVIRELGRGGMGVVYLARNKLMNRLEVLKVLNKEMLAKEGRADRFLREIQSAARLHHPNVVAAYTALQMGDLLVFAMEYVEGDDLAKLVRARGPLPIVNACYFAYQAAQGLQHAHECGMIHRDIKPGNLILFRQGKKAVVKILDFGLAKVTSERGLDRTLTQEGQMLGTPDYIAPEQTLDAQKADIRSDIYSLGCTLYHLLTGNTPFSGNSLFEVLQAHHSIEAKPLNLVRPDVPVELASVVAKMMAKEPNRRYQTPAEVVQALKPFLKPGGLTSPQPESSRMISQTERPAAAVAPAPAPDDDDPALAPMEAVQPAERWKSLIDMAQFGHSSTARSAIRKRVRRQPPWMWPSVAVGALLLGVITAWASGVFSVKTKDGVIVLQGLPDNAEVLVDGDKVSVRFPEGGGPAEITVPPGKRGVQVKKDGFNLFGEEVIIARGETKLLTVRREPLSQQGNQRTRERPEGSIPGADRPGLKSIPHQRATIISGQWAIVGDELVQSAETQAELAFGDIDWSDYDLTLDLQKVNGSGHGIAVEFHRLNLNTFCWFGLGVFENKGCELYFQLRGKRLGRNGENNADNWVWRGIDEGRWYSVKISVRKSSVKCYLDRDMLFEDSHSSFSHGGIALRTMGVQARFRRIKVTSPDGQILFPEGLPDVEQEQGNGALGPEGVRAPVRPAAVAEPATPPQVAQEKETLSQTLSADRRADGFVPLFNGKDTSGWTFPFGSGDKWTVANGVLSADGNTHIGTEKAFKDFHLRMSVRTPDNLNKVVGFRLSSPSAKNYGFHLGGTGRAPRLLADGDNQLDPQTVVPLGAYHYSFTPPGTSRPTRSINDLTELTTDMRRRKVSPLSDNEWHQIDVIAVGNAFQMLVDERVISAFRDEQSRLALGPIYIGLPAGAHIDLREIAIKELTADSPEARSLAAESKHDSVSLFNGKDFTNWAFPYGGREYWTAENGVIHGTNGQARLVSVRSDYKDFHLHLEMRSPDQRNKFLIFRSNDADGEIKYYSVSLGGLTNDGTTAHPGKHSFKNGGGIFAGERLTTDGLTSLKLVDFPLLTPKTWHTVELKAVGNTFTLWIDEQEVAVFRDDESRLSQGQIIIGLGKDARAEIRKIEIKELAPSRSTGFGGLGGGFGRGFKKRTAPNDMEDATAPKSSASRGGGFGGRMGGMGGGLGNNAGLGGMRFGGGRLDDDPNGFGFGPASKEKFFRLFNGNDFTNWTFPKGGQEKWTIEDGILRGEGAAFIATARSDYKDFHLRLWVRTADQINKSLIFRSHDVNGQDAEYCFHLGGIRFDRKLTWPLGAYHVFTGEPVKPNEKPWTTEGLSRLKSVDVPFLDADKWYHVEIIAIGHTFRLLLDGREVSAFRDNLGRFSEGQIMIGLADGRLELRDIEVNEKLAKPAAAAPKKSPRKSSKPAPANDALREGTVWRGSRTYRKGFWQGVTVDYEIQVLKRLGPKFTGVKFDNGAGRNRLPVEGEIHGKSLAWREGTEWRMVGKLDGDTIAVQFHADFGNGKTEGSGQLKRSE
jgi:serine/threonine protein kinase